MLGHTTCTLPGTPFSSGVLGSSLPPALQPRARPQACLPEVSALANVPWLLSGWAPCPAGPVEYVVSKRMAVWLAQRPGGEESERVIAA